METINCSKCGAELTEDDAILCEDEHGQWYLCLPCLHEIYDYPEKDIDTMRE